MKIKEQYKYKGYKTVSVSECVCVRERERIDDGKI